MNEDSLFTLLQITDEDGKPIILKSGDAIKLLMDFNFDNDGMPFQSGAEKRAIIIAPTIQWAQHRARDLKYSLDEVMVVSFTTHSAANALYGYRPDENGDPIIYLSGWNQISAGVQTPLKREWRDAIKRARHLGFEIINLDESALAG